jgi:multimeric flavodoxin WrbA
MKVTVFHGSPRKGNTYKATKIFMEEMAKLGDVQFCEFFLPSDLKEFCKGCQLCFSNPPDSCPHHLSVEPILKSVLDSDALIFATPHYGAGLMSAGMKNLLDHLDFLTMTITPHKEIFTKKAFIITTASGATSAIKPIDSYLRNWGINRVYSYGIRMFVDKFDSMPTKKKAKIETKLKKKARAFYKLKKKNAYLKTRFMFRIFKMIIKKYVGEGNRPYEWYKEQGYFTKSPFKHLKKTN